ncbi:MAG: DUF5684 domain-containing protein [Ferruginibacter sp.]
MLTLSKKPKWWFVAQLVPLVGWFFSLVILIEFVKCYGKFKPLSTCSYRFFCSILFYIYRL